MKWQVSILLLAISLFGSAERNYASPPTSQKPLTQEIYIWQRSWNEPVREALQKHAPEFAGVVTLNAEVTWKNASPQLIRVPVDYKSLRTAKTKIGLALRVGVFPGPFEKNDSAARYLQNLAHSLVTEARANQLNPYELQIDFDCAESKLDGYRIWVESIREKLAPLPVVITALPSWLNQPSFPALAKATDGYILQVHSFERPKTPNSAFQLCDPQLAKASISKAAKIGVPFRVALPTYGYVVAFTSDGRFLGLSAEGPNRNWPANAQLREVRSDPQALSALVQELHLSHAAELQGIIWYRMPIALDVLNWTWPTLKSVMAGRSPQSSSQVEMQRPEAGLVEINLRNNGELDLTTLPPIKVSWKNARLLASDALCDYEAVDISPNAMQFITRSNIPAARLLAGDRLPVGWLRYNTNVEVQIEINTP